MTERKASDRTPDKGRYVFVSFACCDCGDQYPRTTRRTKCKCGCSLLQAHEEWLPNEKIAAMTTAEKNFDKRYQGGKLP